MFVRSEYIGNSMYRITDSNFEEIITLENRSLSGCEAVIRVYEKQGLNVVPNLFRAIQRYSINGSGGASVDHLIITISNSKDWNPSFHKYKDELMKYLVLV